jgi:hypothetical protein
MALTILASASATHADPTILQPDIEDWVHAAQTGRAAVLFVGDSIAGAFNEGFSTAAATHFGLAGTGVTSDGSSAAAAGRSRRPIRWNIGSEREPQCRAIECSGIRQRSALRAHIDRDVTQM